MSIYHKHHIVPKHMGGTDDPSNLIELTITEHAEAHLRLWEEHGIEYDRIAYLSLSKMIDRAEAIRQVQSETMKKQWSDPEYRKHHGERLRKFNIKRYQDPEERKRTSEATKLAKSTPEVRKRISEAAKKRYQDPEARKRTSEAAKLAKSTPEARKRMSEASKKVWSDPEARKRQSEATKRGIAAAKARRAAATTQES